MKSPEERGPFAAWAVDVRKRLGLTSEQVAAATGYSESAIRKFEGGSAKPSRYLRQKVSAYLERVAEEQAVVLTPSPGEVQATPNDDLAAVLRELVDEVRLSRLAADRNADVLAELLGVVLAGRLPQSGTGDADELPVPLGTGR